MARYSYKSGIYGIVNLINGKVYIGSSVDLRRRENQHINALRRGKHPVEYFQRSWTKYGESNFVFVVIEECTVEQCIIREQYWLDSLESYKFENGYNKSPTAGSCLGFKHSEETKAMHSKRMAGKKLPEWWRQRIADSLRGRTKSAEHRANIWKNRKGWKHPEESRKKISSGLKKASAEGRRSGPPVGWKHSEESKQLMSKLKKGKPKSREHAMKIGESISRTLRERKELASRIEDEPLPVKRITL